jgi:hypothetical protein
VGQCRHLSAGAFLRLAMVFSFPGWNMGFCCPPALDPPLREMIESSKIALVGDVCQVHEDDQGNGTTAFHVRHVFKTDPPLGRKKIIHLP